ncbi:MAG: hypothetical protein CO114_08060 [Euryarchaeota archaeon CG_4_9_14_3_um_filter_38_12]|nr:MAG: hypothetical protein CO114_08060 [Euryarchaeota archaeon CG_4_9_14_3_um_filter_38_12]
MSTDEETETYQMILDGLKNSVKESEKELIRAIYNEFFKDVTTSDKFGKNLSNYAEDSREIFCNACRLLHTSKRIKDECKGVDEEAPNIKTLLLFIVAEALSKSPDYMTFKDFLVTKKNAEGVKERDEILAKMNIQTKEEFNGLINNLFEAYNKFYGSKHAVVLFFENYISKEDKKKIVKAYWVRKNLKEELNIGTKKFVPLCFSKNCLYRNSAIPDNYEIFYGKYQNLLPTLTAHLIPCEDNSILCFYDLLSELNDEQKINLLRNIYEKRINKLIPHEKCKLNDEKELNKVMASVISDLYGYLRNQFVHLGRNSLLAPEREGWIAFSGVTDVYKKRPIHVTITFTELRDIIIKGVTEYYKRNIEKIGVDKRIGIFAYGSLINDAGPEITPHIVKKIDRDAPKPVEYARSSSSRGGAPTLVFYDKGAIVKGKILVLDLDNSKKNIDKAKEWLRKREGNTCPKYIKIMQMDDFETVLYCDIPSNINPLVSDKLAELAIESVKKCKVEGVPEKNGVRYLINSINNNIVTPLTKEYMNKILQKTNSSTLEEAEKKLLGD